MMNRYTRLFPTELQVGMSFTGPLLSSTNQILLQEYSPVLYEYLIEWSAKKYSYIMTTGHLVNSDYEVRYGLPGFISLDLRQKVQHYYRSLQYLKEAFKNPKKLNLSEFQKICSEWMLYLLKGMPSYCYLQIVRYANPLPQDYMVAHILDTMLITLGVYSSFNPNYSSINLMQIAMGSLLFDIGMFNLPNDLKNNTEIFDDAMKKKIQQHTVLGYRFLVEELKVPNSFALPALEHHERADGSGYPRQLKGNQISAFGMIIGLADIFCSQIRSRVSKSSKEPVEILKDFLSTTMPLFNGPSPYLNAFISYLTVYPVTTFLELSTGELAVVVAVDPSYPKQPTVMKILNSHRDYELENSLISLSDPMFSNISVKGIIDSGMMANLKKKFLQPIFSFGVTTDQNPNTMKFMKHLIK
ncbi:MAG: HD-GYP domain-containing protein [Brevinemataceae bacterium]